jgi:amino acid adenylation domain-containing protein
VSLAGLLDRSVSSYPDRVALETVSGETVRYDALDEASRSVAHVLAAHGVGPGDRVGLALPKSPASVASLFGVQRAGAAHVPVDAGAPLDRNATIFGDSQVTVALAERGPHEGLAEALGARTVEAAGLPKGVVLLDLPGEAPRGDPELAYILSTSGSTGRPKGVMITQANALGFVRWCEQTLPVGPADRLSSHAPFHFDLSVLDLYLALGSGARLLLVDEATGKQPRALAPLIAERGLTSIYATPSVLGLLVQHGRLERHDYSSLRQVLFAGEVFPVRHLRALTKAWAGARFWNLYGPTETNVCTAYEVPVPLPAEREAPCPIGPACSHCETRVVAPDGSDVAEGEEGELVVHGSPVTPGYWELPERTAEAFLADAEGRSWYRTGDVVRQTPEGYVYVGRRDRMVKRRGHRVELGEVEARLHRHPNLSEVAVVALPDDEDGLKLLAHAAWHDGTPPSLIELKAFCAEHLPASMVPDAFRHHEALPKTSTDKVDHESLRRLT